MKLVVTWILIADGSRARVLTNDGSSPDLKAIAGGEFTGLNVPGREIDSDRPGRTFDSAGRGRHAKEPHLTPRRLEARKFAHEMASYLEHAAKRGMFDRLIVVAPPRALGDIRAALPKSVQAMISAEVNKDLTHIPDDELASHIRTVMANRRRPD